MPFQGSRQSIRTIKRFNSLTVSPVLHSMLQESSTTQSRFAAGGHINNEGATNNNNSNYKTNINNDNDDGDDNKITVEITTAIATSGITVMMVIMIQPARLHEREQAECMTASTIPQICTVGRLPCGCRTHRCG